MQHGIAERFPNAIILGRLDGDANEAVRPAVVPQDPAQIDGLDLDDPLGRFAVRCEQEMGRPCHFDSAAEAVQDDATLRAELHVSDEDEHR